ncbi:MAG: class I tRNA ligase family protein [Patescibacteria group bacterium]
MDKQKNYNPQEIEPKWQSVWEEEKIYQGQDSSSKPKKYILIEFPYASGEGLHVGHCRPYTALDIVARKSRMDGYNVLFPFGWDAFGLPTENYAIKHGINPTIVTAKNTANFKKQAQRVGFSFDWSREIDTSKPEYYKWTQWIFLQLYKAGLAYKKKMPINWCPSCKTGLANEEVIAGNCERCGTPTTKKELSQWMLKITAYADKLLNGLKDVDYLPAIKDQQANWIGRSEGASIKFKIQNSKLKDKYLEVFTTRPDTLFGVTFMVLAPEHELIEKIITPEQKKDVDKYVKLSLAKSNIERQENKEKTGVFTGSYAVNPINNEKIPIWIADYVLADYGTGAIMAVPAHDQRDWDFASKYDLPIKEVIIPKIIDTKHPLRDDKSTVFRQAIQAIVIDPKTKKILCLRHKKFPWTTLIVGGIEEGEDTIAAAQREIAEETGFFNLKFIKTLGLPVQSNFYAAHKDVNRQALFTALVFELIDNQQQSISADEQEKYDLIWLTWDELEHDPNLNCSEFNIWKERFFNNSKLFSDYGVTHDSGEFSGLDSAIATEKIITWLQEQKLGSKKVNYNLRDWVFSRQHYWGEPIPIVYCEQCGTIPLPEKDLPLILPDVKNYQPTDTGESPLASIDEWVNTTCPTCGGPAKRETDTMPNWAGSSWYYLRYCDPHNEDIFADYKKLQYWSPVDIYNGGMEHVTLHLLYSRFWHKFLFDQGLVPTSEPYQKRIAHGMVLGEGGIKMSKSKGNVINPIEVIDEYGADTLRGYEMFMGPYTDAIPWDTNGVKGVNRFLFKLWTLAQEIILVNEKIQETPDQWLYDSSEIKEVELASLVHKNIKRISSLYDKFSFNTVVSNLMIFVNDLNDLKQKFPLAKDPLAWKQALEGLLLLLSPICPHVCEELWHQLGHNNSINLMTWPQYDPDLVKEELLTIPIQVNGKRRAEIVIAADLEEKTIISLAKSTPEVTKFITGKEIVKEIYIKGKIVNIVVK